MQKGSESSAGRAASAASQATVEQVAAYLRANLDVPMRLSTLCEVAGLSEQLPFVDVPRGSTPDAACDATPGQRRDAETLIKRDD